MPTGLSDTSLYGPATVKWLQDQRLRESQPVDWPVVLILMLMPITWIPLVDLGFSSLEFRHLAGFLLVGLTVLSGYRLGSFVGHFKVPWVFLALLLYGLIVLLSATHGRIFGVALGLRSFYWATVAWVIFSRLPSARTVHVGAIAGFALYLFAVEVSAQRTGTSMVDAVWSVFSTGSFIHFRFQFLPAVAQAFGNPWEADVISGNHVNTFAMVCLNVMFLYFASRPGMRDFPFRRVLDIAVAGFMLMFVFAVLARAVVLCLAIGALIAGILSLIRLRAWFLVFAAGFAFAMFAVYVATAQSGYGAALEARLFEDTASFSARLYQWRYGIPMVQERPWFGHGVYALDTGQDFHNLFLGSFVGGGVFTFLVACFFYISVLYLWVKMLARLAFQWPVMPGWSSLWIPSLAIIAFVRPMVGGALGELGADGWIMLGVAMSVALRMAEAPAPAGLYGPDSQNRETTRAGLSPI